MALRMTPQPPSRRLPPRRGCLLRSIGIVIGFDESASQAGSPIRARSQWIRSCQPSQLAPPPTLRPATRCSPAEWRGASDRCRESIRPRYSEQCRATDKLRTRAARLGLLSLGARRGHRATGQAGARAGAEPRRQSAAHLPRPHLSTVSTTKRPKHGLCRPTLTAPNDVNAAGCILLSESQHG